MKAGVEVDWNVGSGMSSAERWRDSTAIFLCTLVLIYAIFPSESSSERFALFVRLGALGAAAALAIFFGEVRRELAAGFCFLSFFFVLVVSWSNAPYVTPRLVNLVATILLSALLVAGSVSGRGTGVVLRAINALLVVSAVALFVQAGLYLLSGSVVEVHGLIFPWGESRSAELERFGIARLSGLHTEPGTHSAYTVGLLVLRSLYGGRLFDRIGFFSVGSVAVTLSFWGVIAAGGYFILYGFSIVRGGVGFRVFLSFSISLAFLASVFYLFAPNYLLEDISNYFRLRSELGDGSGGAKVIAWQMGLKSFGDVVFLGFPIGTDYCNGCISPQDAGLVLNLVIYLGLSAAILFVGVFFAGVFLSGGFLLTFFSGLVLVAKFYYFDPVVWLLFFSCLAWVLRGGGSDRC